MKLTSDLKSCIWPAVIMCKVPELLYLKKKNNYNQFSVLIWKKIYFLLFI